MRKGHLMNLVLHLLNGHVDAKWVVALLVVWGVQLIVVVGIALIASRSQAGSN